MAKCRKFKEDYVADEMLARMRLHQKTVEVEKLKKALRREECWARIWASAFAALVAGTAAVVLLFKWQYQ